MCTEGSLSVTPQTEKSFKAGLLLPSVAPPPTSFPLWKLRQGHIPTLLHSSLNGAAVRPGWDRTLLPVTHISRPGSPPTSPSSAGEALGATFRGWLDAHFLKQSRDFLHAAVAHPLPKSSGKGNLWKQSCWVIDFSVNMMSERKSEVITSNALQLRLCLPIPQPQLLVPI